jgi:alpha-tubulin suppressor-like RCC1 family protein
MGQLGLGSKKAHYHPQLISSLKDKCVVQIAAGISFSAAVTGKFFSLLASLLPLPHLIFPDKGHLWMWGHNGHGQLGLGHTNKMTVPTQVTFFCKNKLVDKIACGMSHTLVVTSIFFFAPSPS